MKDSSKFYSSLFLLIVLNAVIKPLWIFGIDRGVQNTVGTIQYGTYFSLYNLSVVFSFLLDLGLTAFFNRQLASQRGNFISHAGNFLLIKLIFVGVYAAAVSAIALITHVERWDILWKVIFIQAFFSLFVFFRGMITAHQWFRTDAWLSVLDKTLMIIVCGSFLLYPAIMGFMSINKFLSIQVICSGIAAVAAFIILLRRDIGFLINKGPLFDKQIFKTALPFAFIVLLMSVHYRLDGFLLERIHPNGAHEAGIYAAAYRLLDAANMIGVLIASFLLPYIARVWSQQKNIDDVTLTSRHILIMFSVAVACTAFFLAPWIQNILYHRNDEEAIAVLQWCLPALIGYSLVQIYGTIMTATGHIISFCYFVLAAVLINVILNLLLIPSMGAKGCCYAALASQWFCGIATMIYAKQKLKVHFHFRSILIYIFTIGFLSVLFYFGKKETLPPLFLIITGGLLTLLMMIVTGLLGIKKWIRPISETEL